MFIDADPVQFFLLSLSLSLSLSLTLCLIAIFLLFPVPFGVPVQMVAQNLSTPDGTQHTQRKQMEILQARTSAGSLQVVRAQTVQTTSSRWSSSTLHSEVSSSVGASNSTSGNSGALHTTNGFTSHHLLSQSSPFHRSPLTTGASSRLLVSWNLADHCATVRGQPFSARAHKT